MSRSGQGTRLDADGDEGSPLKGVKREGGGVCKSKRGSKWGDGGWAYSVCNIKKGDRSEIGEGGNSRTLRGRGKRARVAGGGRKTAKKSGAKKAAGRPRKSRQCGRDSVKRLGQQRRTPQRLDRPVRSRSNADGGVSKALGRQSVFATAFAVVVDRA